MDEQLLHRGHASAKVVEVIPLVWPSMQREIVDIENKSFEPSIRDDLDYLSTLVHSSTSIFLALKDLTSGKCISYLAADQLENFPETPGVLSDAHFGCKDTIYIASVAVHPSWRRRGFGIALQKECLRRAFQRGFLRATGHVQHGALARMGLGGRALRSFEDWYGTGRTFDYVEISTSYGR